MASSRVGTRTRARGRRGARLRPSARRVSVGRPNASVLPEPVWPRPSTSLPARASGMVAVWIGKGVVMPSRASRSTSRGAVRGRRTRCPRQRCPDPPAARRACSPGTTDAPGTACRRAGTRTARRGRTAADPRPATGRRGCTTACRPGCTTACRPGCTTAWSSRWYCRTVVAVELRTVVAVELRTVVAAVLRTLGARAVAVLVPLTAVGAGAVAVLRTLVTVVLRPVVAVERPAVGARLVGALGAVALHRAVVAAVGGRAGTAVGVLGRSAAALTAGSVVPDLAGRRRGGLGLSLGGHPLTERLVLELLVPRLLAPAVGLGAVDRLVVLVVLGHAKTLSQRHGRVAGSQPHGKAGHRRDRTEVLSRRRASTCGCYRVAPMSPGSFSGMLKPTGRSAWENLLVTRRAHRHRKYTRTRPLP